MPITNLAKFTEWQRLVTTNSWQPGYQLCTGPASPAGLSPELAVGLELDRPDLAFAFEFRPVLSVQVHELGRQAEDLGL